MCLTQRGSTTGCQRFAEGWTVCTSTGGTWWIGLISWFRYCNMDFVMLSSCTGFYDLNEIFFSYNIACQWWINLSTWMKKMQRYLQLPKWMHMGFGVPKCHCPGHQLEFQCNYSMNVQPGVGQTDREGVECTWSCMNACMSCTKVMGPGHHHNTLDELFGSHNWQKCCGHGTYLVPLEMERSPHITFCRTYPGQKV